MPLVPTKLNWDHSLEPVEPEALKYWIYRILFKKPHQIEIEKMFDSGKLAKLAEKKPSERVQEHIVITLKENDENLGNILLATLASFEPSKKQIAKLIIQGKEIGYLPEHSIKRFIADSYGLELAGEGYFQIYVCPRCDLTEKVPGGSYVPTCDKDKTEMKEIKKNYKCPTCGKIKGVTDPKSSPPRCHDMEMKEIKKK